jgi:trk system potassium uptake protein TrkH
MTETAKGLWGVYAFFSVACALAYWWGGMRPLDALMHMFTTVSLGGLSSYDASFGHFQSPLLEAIAVLFMLVASCNFALYFVAVRKRSMAGLWRDPELRATLGVLVGGGLLVSVLLWAKGTYAPLDALRHGMFNVVSVATTTGYATVDYLVWPVFAPVHAAAVGGGHQCRVHGVRDQDGAHADPAQTGSARDDAPGAPRAVQPVRLGDAVVDHTVIFSVLAFMLVYGGTVIGLSMVLLLTDLDPVTAFSAVLASVNCMGPGLGAVGPSSNFAVLTDFQVWVCTLAMLLGRLEFLSVMALLAPSFWRR